MKWWLSLILALLVLSCPQGRDRDLPEEYRRIAVPNEVLDSPEAIGRGRDLFAKYCALCHGKRGDGDGARNENFSTPPRDLTDSEWRDSTSPRLVFVSIREGVPGTAMPSWRRLSVGETWDLVAYILSLSSTTTANPTLTGPRDPNHRESARSHMIMTMTPSRSSLRVGEST